MRTAPCGNQLVGFPPGEARMDSLLAMDVVDPFEIVTNAQALRNMQSMAKAATDVTFITVSDVHLDSTTVRSLGSHVSPHNCLTAAPTDDGGAAPPVFRLCRGIAVVVGHHPDRQLHVSAVRAGYVAPAEELPTRFWSPA